jgi:hypothetical protein
VTAARAAAWGYAVAVLVAAAPIAVAGFTVGASVRDVLDDVVRIPPSGTVVLQLGADESRSLLQLGEPDRGTPGCRAEALADEGVTLDELASPSEVVRLGRNSWTVVATLEADGAGAVRIRCPADGSWALAPDLSSDGFTGDLSAALGRGWLLATLGLVAGAGAAVVVALRSRNPGGH